MLVTIIDAGNAAPRLEWVGGAEPWWQSGWWGADAEWHHLQRGGAGVGGVGGKKNNALSPEQWR